MSPAMTNAVITLTSEVENVMYTLCDLLDRETDVVKASDFKAFRDMQNDKFSLLTRYRSLMETLQRQSNVLQTADESVKKRLGLLQEKFETCAERNARALDAGQSSMTRILDRIVRCARETVHANRQSYTKNGAASYQTQLPVSIQINEVL